MSRWFLLPSVLRDLPAIDDRPADPGCSRLFWRPCSQARPPGRTSLSSMCPMTRPANCTRRSTPRSQPTGKPRPAKPSASRPRTAVQAPRRARSSMGSTPMSSRSRSPPTSTRSPPRPERSRPTGRSGCRIIPPPIRRPSCFWCARAIRRGSTIGTTSPSPGFPWSRPIRKPPAARVGTISPPGATA